MYIILKANNVNIVHYIGAALCFFGLFIFLILQTFISNRLSFVLYSTKFIFLFRLILILVGLAIVVVGLIYTNIASIKFNGLNKMKWLYSDGVIMKNIFSFI